MLEHKLPKLFDLLAEMLGRPRLDHRTRIDELLHMARSRLRESIVPSGHAFVSQRLAAYGSPAGRYAELASGLTQYDYLEATVKAFEADPDGLLASLRDLQRWLLASGQLHLHLTGSREHLARVQSLLPGLAASLAGGPVSPVEQELTALTPNEGFTVPSKIQYVGKGMNLYRHGYAYRGTMEVLKKLLSRDYLWNRVRVQGNAYGCFGAFDLLSGMLTCVSYRDPNLASTLTAYDEFADFLAGLDLDRDAFEKLMIGTMGSIDAPRTPDQKGAIAFSRWRSGITADQQQRWRDEVLATTPDDLRGYAELFRRFAAEGDICVIGGDDKVRAEAARFTRVKPVFG